MKKNNPWTLLQDIDGCLADFNTPFKQLLFDLHGPPPKGECVLEHWHWPQEECGYSQVQVDAAWDQVDESFWRAMQPLPGAVKALDRIWWMEQEGLLTPYFVTGRLPWARHATCMWLDEYGGFRFPQVICTSAKHNIAEALAGNVAAVEDKPSILKKLGVVGGVSRTNRLYAVEYPYNKGLEFYGVQYVRDTFEAIEDLEKAITNKEAPAEAEAKTLSAAEMSALYRKQASEGNG